MKSRKDQVQAHAYVVGRLTSALVHGEPDAPQSPMRRTALGSFGGLLLGALAVAGFLIWGLISPPSAAAVLKAGELVVVKQTGSRYIYAGGALHPVLNWSSALLLLNGASAITSVPVTALAGVPQGPPLGIAGAPDALPALAEVNTGSWLVCAQSSGGRPLVSLAVGVRDVVSPVPADAAVIVSATNGSRYLLYGGQRLRLDAPWIAGALGLGQAPVVSVSATWLNAVPAAADLRPLPVANRGAPGPVLGGLRPRAGQVLADRNVGSPSQYYVVVTGGVTPVSPAQAAVLLTDPATIAAYGSATVAPVPVSPAAIATARVIHQILPDGASAGAPSAPPANFTAPGQNVPCMDYAASGGSDPALVYAPPVTGAPPGLGLTSVTMSPELAGVIEVEPDGGALVRPEAAPGVSASALFLVTDAGVKFPLPSAGTAEALGYRAGRAARLPAALLGLLPTGPALDLAPLRG